MTRYIFVVGGVMSSVGKGTAAASIGKILQARGFKTSSVKCDMYVNIDAGTIRPTEHGEVWVTDDGGEIDQDLGNYERFLSDANLFMEFLSHVVIGWLWLDIAVNAQRNILGGDQTYSKTFYESKIHTMKFYFKYELYLWPCIELKDDVF